MKKSVKALGLCALVLPCAFALTACGGNPNTVKVDTYKDADYAAVETSEIQELMGAQTEANLTNYRFTINATTDTGNGIVEMTMNAAISVNVETQKAKASADYTMKAGGQSGTMNLYIDGDDYYVKAEGQKIKFTADTMSEEYQSMFGQVSNSSEWYNVDFTQLAEGWKKLEKNNKTLYMNKMTEEGSETSFYFIFENGELTSSKIVMSMTYSGTKTDTEMSLVLASEEDVKLPTDLNTYPIFNPNTQIGA